MLLPLHVGIGHPSLVWIAASAILAFVAGLVVNLYRSSGDDAPAPSAPEKKAE
ncbi:hypothetical protein [Halorussus amylolyticus]|uniref:hypothetical protein n=1 Tax=Halorussus amylolyticus TaxID=1126242 RepID=UPI00192FABAE|nr:hypothetical protein [Halorussus amylolyticus]